MEWEVYDKLVEYMLKDTKTKENYEKYVIKDITFKEWIVGCIDDHLFSYSKQRRRN